MNLSVVEIVKCCRLGYFMISQKTLIIAESTVTQGVAVCDRSHHSRENTSDVS